MSLGWLSPLDTISKFCFVRPPTGLLKVTVQATCGSAVGLASVRVIDWATGATTGPTGRIV